tara:strand:- start:1160 stop:1552 length:393 start_codon:yes stop_codon:yes gene_type:complete
MQNILPAKPKEEPIKPPPPSSGYTWRWFKEKMVDLGLILGILLCFGLLVVMAGKVMAYVCIGVLFSTVAAYTVVRGQTAEVTTEKILWFVATGFTVFLFIYWAFTFVFRPPKNQDSVGCGGVQFIHHEEL